MINSRVRLRYCFLTIILIASYHIAIAQSIISNVLVSPPENTPQAIDNWGAPDNDGYMWRDNFEPNGPTYRWFDISLTGTDAGIYGTDRRSRRFPLGITFSIYDSLVDMFNISTDGELKLYRGLIVRYSLLPFFTHMSIDSARGDWIKYQNLGTDTLVVSWRAHILPGTNRLIEFQALLVTHSSILFQYRTVPQPALARIGLKNSLNTQLMLMSDSLSSYALPELAIAISQTSHPVSPVNNSFIAPSQPVTLQWSRDIFSDYVDLYLSDNRDSISNLAASARIGSNLTTSSYVLLNNLNQWTNYYWTVVGVNSTTHERIPGPLFTFLITGLPMSGNYTIGGLYSNFASIHDAIRVLNIVGTTSDVTFLIQGGTYSEPSDTILASAGSGASHRICFRPASSSAVRINFLGTADTPGLTLLNAPYITFDGRPNNSTDSSFLTITTPASRAILVAEASHYCSFRYLTISITDSVHSSHGVIGVSFDVTAPQNDSIIHCQISGGANGIYLFGGSSAALNGWWIEQNEIVNSYNKGIVLSHNVNRTTVVRNYLHWSDRHNAITGIEVLSPSVNDSLIGNKVICPITSGAATGIHFQSTTSGTIANNMISLTSQSGNSVAGILVQGSGIRILHNSVYVSSAVNPTAFSYAFGTEDIFPGSNSISAFNNFFILIDRQQSSCLQLDNLDSNSQIDYNLYSVGYNGTEDTQYLARVDGTLYNDLSELQSLINDQWNMHSWENYPPFLSATDLHFPSQVSTIIESRGTPTSIRSDIDGRLRNSMTPDIGCVEGDFTFTTDFTPPLIQHETLTNTSLRTPRVCVATITDSQLATGPLAPRIYFKSKTATTWTSASADSIRNNRFYFTISGYMTGTIVQYYFLACDNSNNVATLPLGGFGAAPYGQYRPPTFFEYTVEFGASATVGSSNADFRTLTEIVRILNQIGISRDVTVYIQGGYYYDSTLTFTRSIHSGSNAHLTFRPAAAQAVVVISRSGPNIVLNQADGITFDGSTTSSNTNNYFNFYANLTNIEIENSSFCTFSNINFHGYDDSHASETAISATGGQLTVANTVRRCAIYSNYGISFETNELTSDWTIHKNTFYGDTFGYSVAIYLRYAENFRIIQNQLNQTHIVGVRADRLSNSILDGNYFPVSSYGIQILSGGDNRFSNNMIAVNMLSSASAYGISTVQGSNNVFVYNTIRVDGPPSTNTTVCLDIKLNSGITTIHNNILVNARSMEVANRFSACLSIDSLSENDSIDYNVLSLVNETQYGYQSVYKFGDRTFLSVDELQLDTTYRIERNSIGLMPIFTSNTDLSIDPFIPSPVADRGTPLLIAGFDMDSIPRNRLTPDIGCQERNYLFLADVRSPRIKLTPLASTSETTPRVVRTIITDDHAIASGTNAPRIYYKNSTSQNLSWQYADSIRSDSVYYFSIPGFPYGSEIEYYIAAQDSVEHVFSMPVGGHRANPPQMIGSLNLYSYFVISPLVGVKTIGGINPDFTSLSSAFRALNLMNVEPGGVIFRIRDGVYHDSDLFLQCATQSNRSILFTVDSGATVTIDLSGTLSLQSSYTSFDGRWVGYATGTHLTFRTSAQLPALIAIGENVHNTQLTNCRLDLSQQLNSPTCLTIHTGNSNLPTSDITIRNCEIIGGTNGIVIGGSSTTTDSTLISNVQIDNCQIDRFIQNGIQANISRGLSIAHSRISTASTADTNVTGIYLADHIVDGTINGNRIGPLSGGAQSKIYGILSRASRSTIINNMLLLGDSVLNRPISGISLNGSTIGSNKILFNSIAIRGTSTSTSDALEYNRSSIQADTIWGNVFQNIRSCGSATATYAVAISLIQPNSGLFSNFNILAVPIESTHPNQCLILDRSSNTRISSLNDLNNTFWSNNEHDSYTGTVPFISDTNLHVQPSVPTFIEHNASWRSDVLRDFDNELRTTPRCDIGADEGVFTAIPLVTISGSVRDSINTTPPLAGATVRVGNRTSITASDGRFSISIPAGRYTVTSSKPCFQTDTVTLNIYSDMVVNRYLLHPVMQPDQSSLELVATVGQTIPTAITLTNTGSSPLYWRGRIRMNPPSSDRLLRSTMSSIKLSGQADAPTISSIDQTWGPDGYGYVARDNREPGFPQFLEFRDISSVGTTILNGDDQAIAVALNNFEFSYYHRPINQMWVCTNGFVQLGNSVGSVSSFNPPLPNGYTVNGVFVLQTDLIATVTTYFDVYHNIYYVQWSGNIANYNNDRVQFQLQLHGDNNAIVMAYQSVVVNHLNAVIGIQDSLGTARRYLQSGYNINPRTPLNGYIVSYNDLNPGNNGGWQTWLQLVDPDSGRLDPHLSTQIQLQAVIPDTIARPTVLTGELLLTGNVCPTETSIPISITVLTSVAETSVLPTVFKLYQNYPNPFNPSTEIRFDLKQAGHTRLIVFNTLGRQVAELVNQSLPAGFHSIQFDGSQLANGVYFYRIESGSFRDLKKMILVK